MKKGLLIIISGPSGVGKGTIRAKVMENHSLNLFYSVSLTTRGPRPGEIEGVHYHFVTPEYFKQQVEEGNFLEHTSFVKHNYGTLKQPVFDAMNEGKNVILEIEVNGAETVMKTLKDIDILSFFLLPPSLEELEKRIRGRCSEDEEAIQKRLKRAKTELKYAKDYKYTIINNNVDEAAHEIEKIIRQEIEKTL